MHLTSLRLPIPLEALGFPDPWTAEVRLSNGSPGWGWTGATGLGDDLDRIERVVVPVEGSPRDGWGIDHIVVTVLALDPAVDALLGAGADLRLRTSITGRSMAFFKVGTVLEVVETPGAAARLYGVALVTSHPLAAVAAEWRAQGYEAGEPHPAVQPNRTIFSVGGLECGLAVMSPDGARQGASP